MAKKRSTTILDRLKAAPASRSKNRPWDNFDPAQRKEWDKVVASIKAGELDHLSMVSIKRIVCEEFGFEVCTSTFRRHLGESGIDKYRT
jgi:hypothetical protein